MQEWVRKRATHPQRAHTPCARTYALRCQPTLNNKNSSNNNYNYSDNDTQTLTHTQTHTQSGAKPGVLEPSLALILVEFLQHFFPMLAIPFYSKLAQADNDDGEERIQHLLHSGFGGDPNNFSGACMFVCVCLIMCVCARVCVCVCVCACGREYV
jgi:hypothetical protein